MTLKLPRLQVASPIVNLSSGRPLGAFSRFWDQFATAIENSVSAIGLVGFVVSDGTTTISRSLVAGTGLSIANGDGSTGNPTYSLANTAVAPGSFGDATHVPAYTVDAQGRLTHAANIAITFPAAPVSSVFGRTGAVVLLSADVISALGFTPANKAGDTFSGIVDVTAGVKLGAFTSNADAPITGYVTVMDSTGTARKLATIA